MAKANMDLRLKAMAEGVPLYRIGQELGVPESTFYAWLRQPDMPKSRHDEIVRAIGRLSGTEKVH